MRARIRKGYEERNRLRDMDGRKRKKGEGQEASSIGSADVGIERRAQLSQTHNCLRQAHNFGKALSEGGRADCSWCFD